MEKPSFNFCLMTEIDDCANKNSLSRVHRCPAPKSLFAVVIDTSSIIPFSLKITTKFVEITEKSIRINILINIFVEYAKDDDFNFAF